VTSAAPSSGLCACKPPAQIDPQAELARGAIAELPEWQGRLLLLRYAGLSYVKSLACSILRLQRLARCRRAPSAHSRQPTSVRSQNSPSFWR
jgi:hypothetical protein